jgi:hypothetical protein
MEFTQSENHVNWSPERKLEARDRAVKLGALERRVLGNRVAPYVAFVAVVGAVGHLGGLIESIKL